MHAILIGLALSAPSQAPAASADTASVMASVTRFVDAFNKGDVKAVAATCAPQTDIVDEFPPHQWNGAGACARWMADYDADAKKNGIADGVVTLAAPKHVDVTGSRAYVVVPADYSYKQKGKPVKETASTMTLVLQKDASGWRITAWSWSKS